MRYKPRLDKNHNEVRAAFEKLGFKCHSLAAEGGGVPDLLCAIPNRDPNCFLVEVKNGELPPSKRGLTADQIRWHANWSGRIWTIENLEQVQECVNFYRWKK